MKPREFELPLQAMRINRILAASTLDPSSDRVVGAASLLARALNARLFLIHSVAPPDVSSWMPRLQLKAAERIEARQRELLRQQAAELDLPEGNLLVSTGLPETSIDEACRQVEADLIVIGATTAASPVEGLLGSTAEHLVRKASRPIVVVRKDLVVPPSRVLAPVDLSTLSTDALHVGLRILEGIGGSELVDVEILFAVDRAQRHADLPSEPEQAEEVVAERLTELVAEITLPDRFRLETRLLSGEPGRQIMARAKALDPDLLLLGTRGRGGLRSLFGSVAAFVVRHAPCNLLMIPPRVAEGEGIAEAIREQTSPTSPAD